MDIYCIVKSVFDSMIGLLGDATEDMVDNLDSDKGMPFYISFGIYASSDVFSPSYIMRAFT